MARAMGFRAPLPPLPSSSFLPAPAGAKEPTRVRARRADAAILPPLPGLGTKGRGSAPARTRTHDLRRGLRATAPPGLCSVPTERGNGEEARRSAQSTIVASARAPAGGRIVVSGRTPR